MPCSLCRETGHNIRTCQKKYSTKASASTERELPEQKDPDAALISTMKHIHNGSSNYNSKNAHRDKIGIPAPSITHTVEDQKKGKNPAKTHEIHLVKNSNIEKYYESDNSQKSKVNRGVISVDENRNVIVLKKNSKIVSPTSKNEKSTKSETFRIEANKQIHDSESSKIKISKNWKDIKVRDGDKDILCDLGMLRFLKGPSKEEGKGHIYMYTYCNDSNVTAEQRSTFKVGMTEHLPERRIRALGNQNNEKYIKVHSVEVAWRRLAENMIHKQLTTMGYHSPRNDVEGGTEWFKGKKDEIIEVINLVIRFLNVYALPLQQ